MCESFAMVELVKVVGVTKVIRVVKVVRARVYNGSLSSNSTVTLTHWPLGCFTKTPFQKKKLFIPSRLPIWYI